MANTRELIEKIDNFQEERDWKQFHSYKDLVISLVMEAAELSEHFRWKTEEGIKEYVHKNKEVIEDEVIDVLYWTLTLISHLDMDLDSAFERKMEENKQKYPVSKVEERVLNIPIYDQAEKNILCGGGRRARY